MEYGLLETQEWSELRIEARGIRDQKGHGVQALIIIYRRIHLWLKCQYNNWLHQGRETHGAVRNLSARPDEIAPRGIINVREVRSTGPLTSLRTIKSVL